MSTNPSVGGVALEAGEDDIIPEDRKKPAEKVVNVKDMAYMNGHDDSLLHIAAINNANKALSTPSLPLPNGVDSKSEVGPQHSTQPHLPPHHSPIAQNDDGTISLNELVVPLSSIPMGSSNGSTAATAGVDTNGLAAAGTPGIAYDSSFPFPSFRPLPSSTNSPAPQPGMTIPPAISSAPMSRNVSSASVTATAGAHHDHAPLPTSKLGRTSTATKPTMLGVVGEKKSFFHKMFHHDGGSKHDAKEKLMLDIPRQQANGHFPSSGQPSPRVPSPNPHRENTNSPPLTPGTPPYHGSDSDHSRPPSRAPSMNGRKDRSSDHHDVHAQPPIDRRSGTPPITVKPQIQRRLSERSTGSLGEKDPRDRVVAAVIAGAGVAVAKEENVVASSGNKFTLKDLLGRGGGEGGKLTRKASQAGSDRASTKGSERDYGDNQSTASLLKKYGVCERAAIGKGATAVVRLAHKWDRREEKLYAVKEFRKRRKNETEKEYVKKLTSEFCISSTLHHTNVVETVDLVQDEQHHWCEVMEYCPGGDLYAAIKKGGMSSQEVECSFKQLLHGISYLHSMGVAHRDIKPENLLLDGRGHVKITDFGVSDVFRMCWEKKTHLSKGLCGSEPYIAPELFDHKEYDARLVDVWAAAVVFYCMQFQELPWRVAKPSDPTFATYLGQYYPIPTGLSTPSAGPMSKEGTNGSSNGSSPSSTPAPLNNLIPRDCRSVIKHMLDPDPKTRWGIDEALKDKWVVGIEMCIEGQKNGHIHQGAGMDIIKIA